MEASELVIPVDKGKWTTPLNHAHAPPFLYYSPFAAQVSEEPGGAVNNPSEVFGVREWAPHSPVSQQVAAGQLQHRLLDRVEEVKAAAERANRDRYAVAVSSAAAGSSAVVTTGGSGGALTVTTLDEGKQNSNAAPSDDFLAWIKRKKEKAASSKKK